MTSALIWLLFDPLGAVVWAASWLLTGVIVLCRMTDREAKQNRKEGLTCQMILCRWSSELSARISMPRTSASPILRRAFASL